MEEGWWVKDVRRDARMAIKPINSLNFINLSNISTTF
jgi:hypothetical protein